MLDILHEIVEKVGGSSQQTQAEQDGQDNENDLLGAVVLHACEEIVHRVLGVHPVRRCGLHCLMVEGGGIVVRILNLPVVSTLNPQIRQEGY